mgnify:CR=1 FL=1
MRRCATRSASPRRYCPASGREVVLRVHRHGAIDDQATANARVQQIAAALAAPYRLDGQVVTVGASIGVVASQPGLASTDDYLRAADAAMYQAKSQRLGVCVFAP